MLTWGALGYWGIVTGLLALLAVFFACMEIMSRIPKTEGKQEFPGEGSGRASSGTRRAA
jgi:hypothetical protein